MYSRMSKPNDETNRKEAFRDELNTHTAHV